MIRKIFSASTVLLLFLTFNVAHTAPSQTIWESDPATEATLQTTQTFDGFSIKLPSDYTLSTSRSFQNSDQWQWHGGLHDDGSRPVIAIWVVKLDTDHASGNVIAYGEQLLADASKNGVDNYSRGLDQVGIDKETGNWVTRFSSKCTLTPKSGVEIPIVSQNYLWLDHGQLLIATIYDTPTYSKESQKTAEAAIWSVHS